jgi:hypothetical protein
MEHIRQKKELRKLLSSMDNREAICDSSTNLILYNSECHSNALKWKRIKVIMC